MKASEVFVILVTSFTSILHPSPTAFLDSATAAFIPPPEGRMIGVEEREGIIAARSEAVASRTGVALRASRLEDACIGLC